MDKLHLTGPNYSSQICKTQPLDRCDWLILLVLFNPYPTNNFVIALTNENKIIEI